MPEPHDVTARVRLSSANSNLDFKFGSLMFEYLVIGVHGREESYDSADKLDFIAEGIERIGLIVSLSSFQRLAVVSF